MTAAKQAAPAAKRWRLWRTWPGTGRPDEVVGVYLAEQYGAPAKAERAARMACVAANCDRFARGEAAANYEFRAEAG